MKTEETENDYLQKKGTDRYNIVIFEDGGSGPQPRNLGSFLKLKRARKQILS